ncbi:MAG: M48 family metalloprotease, partial [Nodosilinea sp.]
MQRQKHFLAMLLVSFWLALWASQGIALARGSWAANPAPPEVPVLSSGDSSLPDDPFQGLSPDQVQRAQLLIDADTLYRAGDRARATVLYSRAKDPQWQAESTLDQPILPILDPSQLSPAGQVYWREAQAGADSGVASRVLVPLKLLVEQYPGFLPGQSLYVEALVKEGQLGAAQASLEAAIARFPYQADLLRAQVKVQMAQEHWIEAAITANQFTLLNPNHPEVEAMANLARENLDRFRQELNQSLTQNLISNLITGAASYLLTGGLWGGLGALDSGLLLLQGEAALGDQLANQVMAQLPMVEDPEIRAYVNDLGQKLAALTGRQEFDYRFEVIMDDSLNAFALPGGKIFIHAGAIVKSTSEAELAGLLGHEIAHAVLSHGL